MTIKDYSESIKFVCSSVYILITGCTYRWVFFATAGVSLVIQNVNNSVVSAKGEKLEQEGPNNYYKVDSLIYCVYSNLSESFQKWTGMENLDKFPTTRSQTGWQGSTGRQKDGYNQYLLWCALSIRFELTGCQMVLQLESNKRDS